MGARMTNMLLMAGLAAALAWAQPGAPDTLRSSYVLGPEDQIVIRAVDAEEISEKPVRVDMNGYIRLPLAGRVRAAGLTIEQLEAELISRLKVYLQKPDVAVTITEFRSQPVSVLGAVRSPGVHQLQGRKTLVEMLSLAGGLSGEAGHSVKITRRLEWGKIPLPRAVTDSSGQYAVAEVSLKGIMEATAPEENITIRPQDVITVPRAEMVYVIGQVVRAGGFVLNEREDISALKALSLAGGLDRTASPRNARILRAAGGSQRLEISLDMKKILDGKAPDVALQPEDILFVPSSTPKKAAIRAAEAAVQIGTGILIWRR